MTEYRFSASLTDDARMIRKSVFMDEQGFKNEFDETDGAAVHIVVYKDGEPAATGRLYSDGEDNTYIIGRAAVMKQYRGSGLGGEMLGCLENKARELGAVRIRVSAQCAAAGFYEKHGYTKTGGQYYDEHCPHISMVKDLTYEKNKETSV